VQYERRKSCRRDRKVVKGANPQKLEKRNTISRSRI